MPRRKTAARSRRTKRTGKAQSTQAGGFVREEMRHKKQGKRSSRKPKQAIAIGLSKARRSGADVKPPKKGKASAATRKKAARDYQRGKSASARRSSTAAKRTSATGKKTRTAAKKTTTPRRRAA